MNYCLLILLAVEKCSQCTIFLFAGKPTCLRDFIATNCARFVRKTFDQIKCQFRRPEMEKCRSIELDPMSEV